MATYASWRARPIFITSTFRDMQAERSHLHSHVFPALEERLRDRRQHLEPIDLRWGVETVSAKDQQAKELLILKVCLTEVRRSRPFLIALIGDRYGWVPPAAQMKAAAKEVGWQFDVEDRSIGELEIQYGVLENPDQGKFSRFYFRTPLPYHQMDRVVASEYSDLFSVATDYNPQEAYLRLEALKTRIRDQVPSRCRDYTAQWDQQTKRVTGLEIWGRQVLEGLWTDCQEAAEIEPASPATWRQEEAWLLERFVATQCVQFIGRESNLEGLSQFALGPVEVPEWGRCIVGEPGSGKSSLFGKLVKDLQTPDIQRRRVLVLSHAAGISKRSSSVSTLLHRWIMDLSAHLGIADARVDVTGVKVLREVFTELLARAAIESRIVCLVDALDQFERSPYARYVTWLPDSWPKNARLIAFALPGEESAALAKRSGVTVRGLQLLDGKAAEAIATTMCARFHKTLNPRVSGILLAKRVPNTIGLQASSSAANPLWLELALDQLLLLDAEDFDRADREFGGGADDRLHALLCAVAEELPPDIESLYDHLLDRIERDHGPAWTRSFAELIALGRTGWRESDLLALMSVIVGEGYDQLRFAALRRAFRSHLVQRGPTAQWDFSHVQLSVAVARRSFSDPALSKERHRVIADHLESLPCDDPIRGSEHMFHLIGADDRRRAALAYSGQLSDEELNSSTETLSDFVVRTQNSAKAPGMLWIISLLDLAESDRLFILCHRCLYNLGDALADEALGSVRVALHLALKERFEELLRREPRNADYAGDLAWSHVVLSDQHYKTGDANKRQEEIDQFFDLAEQLHHERKDGDTQDTQVTPGSDEWRQVDFSDPHMVRMANELMRKTFGGAEASVEITNTMVLTLNATADLAVMKQELQKALEIYQRALDMTRELHRREPDEPDFAFDLSAEYTKLGDLFISMDDLTRAREHYLLALPVDETLYSRLPNHTRAVYLVATLHRLSVVCAYSGDKVSANVCRLRYIEVLKIMKASGISLDDRLSSLLYQSDEPTGHPREFESSITALQTKLRPTPSGTKRGKRAFIQKPSRLPITYQTPIEYQQEEWQRLPLWRRLITKRPKTPSP